MQEVFSASDFISHMNGRCGPQWQSKSLLWNLPQYDILSLCWLNFLPLPLGSLSWPMHAYPGRSIKLKLRKYILLNFLILRTDFSSSRKSHWTVLLDLWTRTNHRFVLANSEFTYYFYNNEKTIYRFVKLHANDVNDKDWTDAFSIWQLWC